MNKILPLLLALVGLGAGGAAGYFLRPAPEFIPEHGEATSSEPAHSDAHSDPDAVTAEYVKLNNQFVIPVVTEAKVTSLVIMSVSLEVTPGETEKVYTLEPKLRDSFLQVLFDHANAGGFNGAFTLNGNMDVLRQSLLEAARHALGPSVQAILISDIVRQDT
ncbi:flagellar basal body-associated FliL family protein [Pseudothioclava arenosa]|uniref:Flagellar protein FliL n=1 Tax=Pseudothioclava arenosa TaxID=1795308 RepID=A0A2A4CQ05_9RHOB|nr:flagellar basal body-associated FliL family protein [Pseudothioclava arenosa]PCD76567.1 flagellar basal body-associated protein FliL [Pseudothioclava arenosa]